MTPVHLRRGFPAAPSSRKSLLPSPSVDMSGAHDRAPPARIWPPAPSHVSEEPWSGSPNGSDPREGHHRLGTSEPFWSHHCSAPTLPHPRTRGHRRVLWKDGSSFPTARQPRPRLPLPASRLLPSKPGTFHQQRPPSGASTLRSPSSSARASSSFRGNAFDLPPFHLSEEWLPEARPDCPSGAR